MTTETTPYEVVRGQEVFYREEKAGKLRPEDKILYKLDGDWGVYTLNCRYEKGSMIPNTSVKTKDGEIELEADQKVRRVIKNPNSNGHKKSWWKFW